MARYVGRRLLQVIPVLLGTTFLIYAAVWFLPGDPFAGKCGQRPCPPAYVAAMTEKYHLDDNVFAAYLQYLGQLLRGDLGQTFAGQSVAAELAQAFPVTLRLALVAIVFEIVIGVAAGVLAALRHGRFLDNLVLVSTLVVIAIPVFVIGYLAQYFVAIRWGWFAPTVSSTAPWSELILPGLVLASLSLAFVARLTRASLAENLRADYVRTAVAKGLPPSRVVGVHALRNSLIPVVTFIGADFGALLGGAIATEGIFNIAGVGGLTFTAIQLREGMTVTALVTALVLVFLLVNLAVDLLYGVIDPRVRYE